MLSKEILARGSKLYKKLDTPFIKRDCFGSFYMRRGTGLLSFWKHFISFISDMSVYLRDATPGSNEALIPLATV